MSSSAFLVKLKMKKTHSIVAKLEFFDCFLDMFLIGNEMQDLAIIIVNLYIAKIIYM